MPGRAGVTFVADAMLGSLARKLRALGLDVSYYKTGDDAGLLAAAASEGRVVLTSDRGLAARAATKDVPAILLSEKSDGARVSAMASACREKGFALKRGDPRCSICGTKLEVIRREAVTGLVPPTVQRRHRIFHRCPGCGRLYWRGSHWKKLRSLARRLDKEILASDPR